MSIKNIKQKPRIGGSELSGELADAFETMMEILKLQAGLIKFLDKENDGLKSAVLDTVSVLEKRGYSLNAPAFKRLKKVVSDINTPQTT